MKRGGSFLSGGLCLLLAAGCSTGAGPLESEKYDQIDPKRNLSRQDYRDFYDENKKETEAIVPGPDGQIITTGNVVEPPIPELAEILATPKAPKIGDTQLVSVAVTDDVPLKDVLIELARLADIDIEVDSGITGGITFRAKDRPFNEVIDRIADLSGLRYTMKNNVLRVERDMPYVQEYSLNLLNIDRSSNNSINVNTKGGGGDSADSSGGDNSSGGSNGSSNSGSSSNGGSSNGSSSSSSGGTNSGSSSTINGKSDGDFWKQFEESVKQILAYKPPRHSSTSTIASQPPVQEPDKTSLLRPSSSASPVATELPKTAPTSVDGPNNTNDQNFYVINRQAGTMTVSATEKQHQMLATFIKKIETNSSAQVLIEAKIIEVGLNQEYKTGINWTKFGNGTFGFTALKFQGVLPPNSADTATLFPADDSATFSILPKNIDLNLAVNFAETFGTTRTISSPRLHATNNQQAVLSFAQNQPYFTLEIKTTPGTTSGTTTTQAITTINSILNTVPIGLILTLQPSINTESNEVTLSVRPTLSKIVDTVSDPAVPIAAAEACKDVVGVCPAAGLTSKIPVVQVREVDSIMKIKSGQVMVIGGLMENKDYNTDTGVPGVSAVPILGNAFKATDKYSTNSELVIFIRATIIPTSGNADAADKTVYEKYIRDPRPLNFK